MDDDNSQSSNLGFFRRRRKMKEKEENVQESTEQEIMSMVEEGHEKGVLQESEAKMIHNIFAFDDKDARDIMTHRKNVVAVDGKRSLGDVLRFVQNREFSRFPVFADEIDNIIGVIHIRDLLNHVLESTEMGQPILKIRGLVRKIPLIPETRRIDVLFQEMQSRKTHMVIVIDEYGQLAGLVTMEDILEEIVGNIQDEYDREEKKIIPQSDGSYIIAGDTEMDEVCDLLHLKQDELEDFDTLNGFLVSRIDKIPSDGEVFSVQEFGYIFQVLLVKDKMIRSVKVSRQKDDLSEKAEV